MTFAPGMARTCNPMIRKSYILSICTAGASENGLADAGVNTYLRLEFGQRSLGDTPNWTPRPIPGRCRNWRF